MIIHCMILPTELQHRLNARTQLNQELSHFYVPSGSSANVTDLLSFIVSFKVALQQKLCFSAAVYPEQDPDAYKDKFMMQGQNINWIFFHPERIRQHSMQTFNSSVRARPLTVNFILSAFTWPIGLPGAL